MKRWRGYDLLLNQYMCKDFYYTHFSIIFNNTFTLNCSWIIKKKAFLKKKIVQKRKKIRAFYQTIVYLLYI